MAYIESERLKLKVQYTTEIKKEIVAFLNSNGKGTFYTITKKLIANLCTR